MKRVSSPLECEARHLPKGTDSCSLQVGGGGVLGPCGCGPWRACLFTSSVEELWPAAVTCSSSVQGPSP